MEPTVRVATTEDAPVLAVLEREARASVRGQRGGERLLQECAAIGDAWPDVVSSGAVGVFVGTIDGVVVAYLVLQKPAAGGVGSISQVWVDAEARELGFGDWLVERAIAAVVDAGGTAIEATSLPGDRNTKNLYERAGITARKLVVSRQLP